MEKKGKRIESDYGEFPLPEAMIQHIQSYLSGKEAARTTVLSKSWYSAWLTRPVVDFDDRDFPRDSFLPVFDGYVKKTVQRYQDSSLNIERFRLCVDRVSSGAHDLIVNAMNCGATDVELDFPFNTTFTLPKEVLGSQTLLRLSVWACRVDGKSVNCSRLQSLSLISIKISDDGFKDIISCCGSIEELSLSYCFGLTLSLVNLYELHKLRRLSLGSVYVDDTFFTDFASRFPCLKDLSWLRVLLRHLCSFHFTPNHKLKDEEGILEGRIDIPNIRKFTCSGSGLPSQLSIKGGSTEWELGIYIECNHSLKNSWFLKLKKILTKFRLSRISLCIALNDECKELGRSEHDLDIEVAPQPLVLENLMIGGPSSLCFDLLLRMFGICRPKFLNDTFYSSSDCNAFFAILCKRFMQKPVTPNCGIPDQDMFGKFGLKKVNVEVYKGFDKKRQPLVLEKPLDPSKPPVNHQDIRFELIWD